MTAFPLVFRYGCSRLWWNEQTWRWAVVNFANICQWMLYLSDLNCHLMTVLAGMGVGGGFGGMDNMANLVNFGGRDMMAMDRMSGECLFCHCAKNNLV